MKELHTFDDVENQAMLAMLKDWVVPTDIVDDVLCSLGEPVNFSKYFGGNIYLLDNVKELDSLQGYMNISVYRLAGNFAYAVSTNTEVLSNVYLIPEEIAKERKLL